jgi:L-threonylcarbamoyladenylate synthase
MAYLRFDLGNITNIQKQVIEVLGKGGIALLPFDTVYGFICDPKNEEAIERIFKLKERNINKTIGIAVSSLEQSKEIAKIDDQEAFMKFKIPGKYTFILKAKDQSLSKYCYHNSTVGVRIPDQELILMVASKFGPIAQTSANKSGKPNCLSISDIQAQFSSDELNSVDLVIDGA